MTENRLLCLGYGYVARRFSKMLREDGWRIAGAYRDDNKLGALRSDEIEPVEWKSGVLDSRAFAGTTAVLVSAPPDAHGCPAFAAAEQLVVGKAGEMTWIGYLSSNGVYGDHGGAWVDETSMLKAKSARARNRIHAEAQWAGLAAAYDLPLVIFRLPGIYGPGRSAIDAVREGRARRIVKEGQVFSRAHVDDIAAALRASINNPKAGALFNIADDEPAPPQDVVTFACNLLGVEPPPLEPIETAKLSPMARSFYDDNKRVSNVLMKSALGVRLTFPSYREGLSAIYQQGGHDRFIQ